MPEELNSANKNPRHIGIIMDGNGRWAEKRGLLRTQGHLEGLSAAKRIVKAAVNLGIKFLTLYTFSTENWKRSTSEVSFIFGLVKQYLRSEIDFYRENQIRIRHAGDIKGLPPEIASEIDSVLNETSGFNQLQLVLAINYGGRDEIVRAVRKLANSENLKQKLADFSEKDIDLLLDNSDIPNPDLIIRTAGEYRTSNFLIWEGAYSEWYFSEKYWPDWDREDLVKALDNYKMRDRRFGGLKTLIKQNGESR